MANIKSGMTYYTAFYIRIPCIELLLPALPFIRHSNSIVAPRRTKLLTLCVCSRDLQPCTHARRGSVARARVSQAAGPSWGEAPRGYYS